MSEISDDQSGKTRKTRGNKRAGSTVPPDAQPAGKKIADTQGAQFTSLQSGVMPTPLPQFKISSDKIVDSASPLCSIEDYADKIVNVAPGTQKASGLKIVEKQTRDQLKVIAIEVAKLVGICLTEAFLEDLVLMSSHVGPMNEEKVWLYLRGALRSDQMSISERLSKVAGSLETVVQKNQQVIMSTNEQNKLTADRLAVVNKHVEQLPVNLGNLFKSELNLARESIVQSVIAAIKRESAQSPPVTNLLTANQYPNEGEITTLLNLIKCPIATIERVLPKLVGKMKWDEYNAVMSGKIDPNSARALLKEITDR